jgi:hypothetical protein
MWKKSTKPSESKMCQDIFRNKSVMFLPLTCSDHFSAQNYAQKIVVLITKAVINFENLAKICA